MHLRFSCIRFARPVLAVNPLIALRVPFALLTFMVAVAVHASPTAPSDASPVTYLPADPDLLEFLNRSVEDFEQHDNNWIMLPTLSGEPMAFEIKEVHSLGPELAARRPDLRNYAAVGVDQPLAQARLSVSMDGLQVLVDSPEGVYRLRMPRSKSLQFALEHPIDAEANAQAQPCGTVHTVRGQVRFGRDFRDNSPHPQPVQTAGVLATYRLALASTVEFTALNGSIAGTETAMNALKNEANLYLERNLAIRLLLVSTSIFDQEPDPFTSGDNELMLDEAAAFFRSLSIPGGFGVGHLLDVTGGGIAALAMACDDNWKGAAVSDGRSLQTFLHELGHQFSASHSFNDNASGDCGNEDQYAAYAAFEPGSGSTLMSYAGACGVASLQPRPDMYFHSGSIAQVLFAIAPGQGSVSLCRADLATGNLGILLVETNDELHVPPLTPFELSVQALDGDGDEVGIRWEQYDLGAPEPPHGDDVDRPIFRSRPGSVDGTRSFPSMHLLFETHEGPPVYYNCGEPDPESCLVGEFLPTRPRTLRFRATALDGRDAIAQRDVLVHVVADALPFQVLSPNQDSAGWIAGYPATVTWDVGHSADPPLNCFSVNILLSLDNGASFPHTLATRTSNSGSHQVQVPELFGNAIHARLKVECNVLGNHHRFFAVSRAFPIVEPVVTHNGDTGVGSLRALLELASQYSSRIQIRFQIPNSLERIIRPRSPLPVIDTRVVLDGWSQPPGGIGPVPRIEISGALLPSGTEDAHGLVLRNQLSEVSGLAITNFPGDGMRLEGGGLHRIHSNWLGLSRLGASPGGNRGAGLRIIDSSDNLIGLGPAATLRGNTIVDNAVGVVIEGAQASGNRLVGNWIGTTSQSDSGLGNRSIGVLVQGAPGNEIGDFLNIDGILIPRGNVISGNQPQNANGTGVRISGGAAAGNRVQANLIGLRADGMAAGLPNGGTGVLVDGAINTQVVGNLIAANPTGIRVDGEGASGTRITGNWIGLEATGQMTISGGVYGIWLRRPAEVGGAETSQGNVVAGQSVAGVYIDGVMASGSIVQGNRIGSDPEGSIGLGNGYGVRIFSSNDHLIGGSGPGEGNLITASNADNLRLEGGSSRVRIEGNWIGTDITGTVALSRHGAGFNVALQGGSDNRIGGMETGAGNLISGFGPLNGGNTHGIGLRVWAGAEGNRIEGNIVGSNATGTTAMGNGGAGIWVTVPGFEPPPLQPIWIAGNLVAGNAGAGLDLIGVNHVRIHGNDIGMSPADGAPLGNGGSGVRISVGSDNWIGGNLIAHSGTSPFILGHGVQILSGQRNRVIGNRIYDNAGLGIDLLGGIESLDRVTPNDACDADSGPNGLQNYPVLTGLIETHEGGFLQGSLNSRPGTSFMVDIYMNSACDQSGHGEGRLWLGSTEVITDEFCNADFSFPLTAEAGGVFTATATDPDGNSSEFSPCQMGLPVDTIFADDFKLPPAPG